MNRGVVGFHVEDVCLDVESNNTVLFFITYRMKTNNFFGEKQKGDIKMQENYERENLQ